MRLSAACVACGVASAIVVGRAQSAQSPAAPQQPVFRGGVDVIRLDVSVVDRDHRPVHGLTAADFTVREDGATQRIIGVSEIEVPTGDDQPAAWLRLVPADVGTNSLGDALRDSRLFVIVMDDAAVPYDDDVTVAAARQIARATVNRMGPIDAGAVVYTRDAGFSQDFTTDRASLLRAIDQFQPRPPQRLPLIPPGGYPRDGDVQRHDNVNRWSRCEMAHPSVPTLLAATQALAQITERRKTIVYISTGEGLGLDGGSPCVGGDAQNLFWLSQRANVNIYAIDPAGLHGTEAYLDDRARSNGRGNARRTGSDSAAARLDFLATLADNTGGDAIINTNDFNAGLDQLFAENGSYYLIGYQSTNAKVDGKFRRVDVRVEREGVSVRARRGYFGPTATRPGSPTTAADIPTPSDLLRVGLGTAPPLSMRVALAPFAATDPSSVTVPVAVTLGVREPAPLGPTDEVITVVTSATSDSAPATRPASHEIRFRLQPVAGDTVVSEWTSRIDLPPGHYEVRLNAHSTAIDRGSSVYGDVDVPDFSKAALALSGVVFGVRPTDTVVMDPSCAAVLPVTPTSERTFLRGEHVQTLLRIHQGGTAPVMSVALQVLVVDAHNAARLDTTDTLAPARFGASRSTDYTLDLATLDLQPGPQLLVIQARTPDGQTSRRDVPFAIR